MTHSVRVLPLEAGLQQPRTEPYYYSACSCGVCGKVRDSAFHALTDAAAHLDAVQRAACSGTF